MTLTFHGLWLLCGLATAVFATYLAPAERTRPAFNVGRLVAWLALAAGFILSSVWLRAGRAIDAAWIGGLVAGVAAVQLVRPPHPAIITLAAGAVAAVWAAMIQEQGLAQPVAIVSGATLPLASGYFSQRTPAFAPPRLQEEALVALTLFGLVVDVAPSVAQGWQSALALNLAGTGASMPLLPVWMVCFAGASMVLGGLWTFWRRG